MKTQMIIRLDPNTKDKLSKVAKIEGKNSSQVVRELIERHIRESDWNAYIDNLWARVGKKLKARGIGTGDIRRAIRDVRAAIK